MSVTERSVTSTRREREEAVKAEQALLADFKVATLEKVDQDKEYQALQVSIGFVTLFLIFQEQNC